MTKILIADDHEVLRSGLRAILEAMQEWTIVAEAADGKEALNAALRTKPDIAIVDYGLPLINGVEVTRQIRERLPSTEVLMFTMHDDTSIIEQALEAGVRSYLLKSDAKHYLISAVEALSAHRPFFVGSVSEQLLKSYLSPNGARRRQMLSPRERVVVQLIAEGRSNKEMSAILSVGIKTIEAQRASAMKKLDLNSTAALVRYAIREKLVEL